MISLFFHTDHFSVFTNYLFESLPMRCVPFRRLVPPPSSVVSCEKSSPDSFFFSLLALSLKWRKSLDPGATEELFDRARGQKIKIDFFAAGQ